MQNIGQIVFAYALSSTTPHRHRCKCGCTRPIKTAKSRRRRARRNSSSRYHRFKTNRTENNLMRHPHGYNPCLRHVARSIAHTFHYRYQRHF